MRWTLLVIFAYLLAVMQSTLFEPRLLGLGAFGLNIRPDLLLLLALFVALRVDAAAAFLTAWSLGLAESLCLHGGEGPLGVTPLLFALLAWLVCLLRPLVDSTRILVQVLLTLAAVFALRVPQQTVLLWLTGGHIDTAQVLQRGLGDAVYSAVLAPYLFWLLVRTVEKSEPLHRGGVRK